MSGVVIPLPGVELEPPALPPASDRPGDPVALRVCLRPWARLQVEQARQFVMSLGGAELGADAARLAYLIGKLEGHAQTLLDVLDTVTEVA